MRLNIDENQKSNLKKLNYFKLLNKIYVFSDL